MSRKIVDLTGKKFGRLTVIERAHDYVSPKGQHSPQWLCECECGNKTITVGTLLKQGRKKSCGYECKLKRKYGEPGVHRKKNNRWTVSIYVGSYNSYEEAIAASNKAKDTLFGAK